MDKTLWNLTIGDNPLVATAIHNGHDTSPEIAELLGVDESFRLREEDPFTGEWTKAAEIQFIAFRSRFEVDLNRPREKAFYMNPEDAWGFNIWKRQPSSEIVQRSLRQYDEFYQEMEDLFTDLVRKFGFFFVFDLHSYNHRRNGPTAQISDPEANPEVNIGTGSMDREFWSSVLDRFIADLGNFNFLGRNLDVRENVRFRGGNFPRWVHRTFPRRGCALAIEFKKFFMDEWTGVPDMQQVKALGDALQSTVPGVLEELAKLRSAQSEKKK